MGFFKDLKQTLQGNTDLSQLTPEQQATVQRNLADVAARQAEANAAMAAATQRQVDAGNSTVLFGPVEHARYGAAPAAGAPMPTTAKGAFRAGLRDMVAGVKGTIGDARQAIAEDFDRGETAPARAAAIGQSERAARDAARSPYLAGPPAGPLITRVVTTGASQLAEVADVLQRSGLAARPDLLYGVYRVPDRLDPNDRRTRSDEAQAPVEWDIVHAPLPSGLPQVPVQAVWLGIDEHWVRRRVGETAVMDEELAVDVCTRLGIGDRQLVAVARVLSAAARLESTDADGTHFWSATELRPLGVVAFHTHPGADAALPALGAHLPLVHSAPAGLHVEVLNWHSIAAEVQPRPQLPALVPARFPHLPATPQELLTMYLEVVGVRPEDCVSTQVTVQAAMAVAPYGNELTGNMARLPELPCADGVARPRLHGGDGVVVGYRDRPDYQEGRQRWAAYCQQVLFARLHLETGARKPVEPHWADSHAVAAATERFLASGVGRGLIAVAGVLYGSASSAEVVFRPATWRYTQPEPA